MRMGDWYRTLVGVFIVLFAAAQQLAVSSNTGIQVVPQIKTSIQNSELSGAAADLWVDAEKGNNTNNGLSPATALLTIQHAADLAGPGTTIHIQPGVYRESILPAQSGTASAWIRYTAESGPGTVKIRGSDPSSALAWTQLTSNTIGLPSGVDPTHIYYADISSWGLSSPPRFVVELNAQGEVSSRLPQAREPDWSVVSEWKYHEFWWAADGGNNVAACNPPTDANPLNCDAASRSLTQLTDRNNDAEPTGIEPGNLTTLGNLTGAALVVKDTVTGTFVFHRKITSHDVTAGRITVDQKCEQGSGSNQPALGWGSKYYIEGLPRLMDSPGEWWYDQSSGRLYLYPRSPGNPAAMNIEISRRLDGINLIDRSCITLNGLTVEFFNRNAVYVSNDSYDMSHGDTIQNTILRYASNGVWLRQYVDPNAPLDRSIDGFTIENSEIAFMDDQALHIYSTWGSNSSAASFTRPGVLNIAVRHNELHHLGFNAESEGVGAQIAFADHFTFEDNHIHHVAHNGIQFMRSVIQSTKKYGFSPAEIKTGNILIRNNIFEKACQNASDCGALKISGTPPDRQVFRDLLVTGNIFRDTIGWTYIAEKRGHFDGGPQSDVQGMGGFGLYVDNASGMNVYRNITYNNAFAGFKLSGVWRDGDIIYYNNTIANSLNGFHFGGKQYDTHDGSVNTRLVNNIMVNNEDYAILLSDADGDFENTIIDHNLYENNGWRTYQQGGEWISGNIRLDVPGSDLYYQTLADIQAGTSWEDHGVEGDPAFWSYDINDHALFDGSSPDFHLTSNSTNAIDRGSASLPASLTALLNKFVIVDPIRGTAPDIGRYEAGFSILPDPSAIAVEPGGTARFTLRLYPSDLPNSVTLNTSNPDPAHLVISLEPTTITAATPAVLTITDTHTESTLIPGLWYSITIGGDGAGFTSTTILHLLVGGVRLYLPVIAR
ncbi:MAG: right-handed parallel beta-helix repeat-containing protein [Anaerolineaceae bacterium]